MVALRDRAVRNGRPSMSRAFPVIRLLLAAAIGALPPWAASAATAVVDLNTTHQVIRGFGGATVFQPPGLPASLTESELDTLFGTGPGQIGFTLLRIRVAEDDAWRAIELEHAREARARGAEVIATPWSPPAAMKTNNSLIDGRLMPSSYADYARYLNDFAKFMVAGGAPLYAISIQNEPDIDVDYESCHWTPEEMLTFCRDHAGAITATRVMAPESFQFRREMSDPILNDPQAMAAVDIIAGHIYGGGLAEYPLARDRGKEVWMTEHLDLSTDWAGALATAKEIHDCLAVANFNAYLWWYLRRYYGPLGEDGVVTRRGHVMTQFARFIRPGAVRIEATANPAPDVFVSAYRRDRLVIVAINQGASAVEQTFTIENGEIAEVTPWVTTETLAVAAQPAIALTDGSFTATLPASSITTFVGEIGLEPPVIVVPPRSHTVGPGHTVVLDVTATGEFLTYQWNHNGQPLPWATDRRLTILEAQPWHAGEYTVTVANAGGSVTSADAKLAVVLTENPGRLINLSTRSPVGAGAEVQIAGFVIAGAAPKSVLARAAGPALTETFGLTGVVLDPAFELHRLDPAQVVAANDDWDPALGSTFEAVHAFPWSPGSPDAASLLSLPPGAYTAVVRGSGGGGIGLAEIYDAVAGPDGSRFVNLSTRSFVGVNDAVQIAGFVVGGVTATTVVIRASGPALAATFGLEGVLADPEIELHRQNSPVMLAYSDEWDESLIPYFAVVGAFPWKPDSADAALVTTLDPGAYTVVVRGKGGGTGLALVEVYEFP